MVVFAVLITALISWMAFSFIYSLLLRNREAKIRCYYRKLYNKQVAEVIARHRQERVAMVHRYEGAVAELWREIKELERYAVQEKTQKTQVL